MTNLVAGPARAGEHLPELDGIRGIACATVVLLHALVGLVPGLTSVPGMPPVYNLFFSGAPGVDLFFALSGFLIGGILLDNKGASNYFSVFWARRAARILPVYILLMLTYAAAVFVRPYLSTDWMDKFLLHDPAPLWPFLFFVQNHFLADHDGGAFWIGITWSLAIEEQFYLIFPFVVFFLPRRYILLFAIAIIVVSPLVRYWLWMTDTFYAGYFSTLGRADGIMFGVLAAFAGRSGPALSLLRRWRPLLDVIAIAITLAIAFPENMSETLKYSIRSLLFAYLIVRIFVSDGLIRRILRVRVLTALGAISYSLYMYHQAVNGLLHGVLLGRTPKVDDWKSLLVAACVIAASILLSALSTRYFEAPIRSMGRRVKYTFANPVAPTHGLVEL